MKSYTDLEQSSKLAEILSLENADMYWINVKREGSNDWWKVETIQGAFKPRSMNIPCWSLATLLSVLPNPTLTQYSEDKWNIAVFDKDNHFKDECFADEPVDACYGMIVKLHEQKLL